MLVSHTRVWKQIVKKCAANVQNDQLQLAELKLLTDWVIGRLRKNLNIHASFVDTPSQLQHENGTSSLEPKDAVGKTVSNAKNMKRKCSKFEKDRCHCEKAAQMQALMEYSTNNNFDASDGHLPPPKLDHRACSFCKQAKHYVEKCPTLNHHGAFPLPKCNLQSQTQLQAELTSGGRIVAFTWD